MNTAAGVRKEEDRHPLFTIVAPIGIRARDSVLGDEPTPHIDLSRPQWTLFQDGIAVPIQSIAYP